MLMKSDKFFTQLSPKNAAMNFTLYITGLGQNVWNKGLNGNI